MIKKQIVIIALWAMALLSQFSPVSSSAAEVDLLINKLVEKGVLSSTEADRIVNEMKDEKIREEKMLRELAVETAKDTVKAEAKIWPKAPKWVDKIKFKGDFRLRYQYQDKKLSDGEKFTRNRGRYRLRLGAVADVVKNFQVGFGLASGSGDPRSTNQTFTNDFETPDLRIDYAYAQYIPIEEVKMISGQFKNPLYQTKDLLWDSDIRPQGIAVPLKIKVNDRFSIFLNPSFFVLEEFKSEEETAWMFALQPGVKIKPSDAAYFQVAATLYLNHNVEGNHFKYSSGSNTTDADGNLIDNFSAASANGEFGLKFNGPGEKLGIFGQFIKSDADSDNTGWLAGVKIGPGVKKFGDWEIKYNYRRLEKDAWLDFLPDSDFYGGATNVKGHEVELKFGLDKHVSLAVDYYNTRKIDPAPGETDEPENLFQFDISFKF